MNADELVAAFVEAHGPVAGAGELRDALAEALAKARAAWPAISIDAAAWIRSLAPLVPAPLVPARPFGDLEVADLYLAFACAHGDARALAACDALLVREAGYAAAAVRFDAGLRDEAIQIVRNLAFVARAERPPAIRDYAGRGTLHGWLRVMVSRELVRLAKARNRAVELEDRLLELSAHDADPVLEKLKDKYRVELANAFRIALDKLAKRERTLLRYQLIDGLTIDEIGAIHRVHRATAARWLATIRDELVEHTRRLLADALGVDTEEAASIVRMVQSQLEVSVIQHLGARRRQ